jgi:hypothetical protein
LPSAPARGYSLTSDPFAGAPLFDPPVNPLQPLTQPPAADRSQRLPLVQRRTPPPAAVKRSPSAPEQASQERRPTEPTPAGPPAEPPAEPAPAPSVNLDKLAHDLLPYVKRLIALERERRPRS